MKKNIFVFFLFFILVPSSINCFAVFPINSSELAEKKCGEIKNDTNEKVKKTFNEKIVDEKDKTTGALLALFLGMFGAHRFYYNDKKNGTAMLLISTFGIFILIAGIFTIGPLFVPFSLGILLSLLGTLMICASILWALNDFFRILGNNYPKKNSDK